MVDGTGSVRPVGCRTWSEAEPVGRYAVLLGQGWRRVLIATGLVTGATIDNNRTPKRRQVVSDTQVTQVRRVRTVQHLVDAESRRGLAEVLEQPSTAAEEHG